MSDANPGRDQLALRFEDDSTRKALYNKLLGLAKELLTHDAEKPTDDQGGTFGVTFYDVRLAAETRGWLTGEETSPVLSFGSRIMALAGGVVVGERVNKHPKANRRKIRVYRSRDLVEMANQRRRAG